MILCLMFITHVSVKIPYIYLPCVQRKLPIVVIKTLIYNLVHTTRFWNSLDAGINWKTK